MKKSWLELIVVSCLGLAFSTGPTAPDAPGTDTPPAQPRLSAKAKSPGAPRTPRTVSIPFFDAHVHLNDTSMQLDLMNRSGISRAIVFWGSRSDNDSLITAAREHEGRLFPFVSVSPERRRFREMWDSQDPELLRILDERLASGLFFGIGEISVSHFPSRGFPEADYSPLHPTMQGIMQLADDYDVPIVIHCELTRMREFRELVSAFPAVSVIWAHGGYLSHFLTARILDEHPNVTIDLSARTWAQHPRSSDFTILRNGADVWPRWLSLIEQNPGRFIVGTDASHHNFSRERRKIHSVMNLLDQLSPQVRDAVATGNVERLLRIHATRTADS